MLLYMTVAWYVYALMGAIIWGLHYPLIGKVLSVASPLTIYTIPNILLFITLPFWYKVLIEDIQNIVAAPTAIKASVVALMFTSILGTIAVYKAVHTSNATLASLIEITYPIFVALISTYLFHQDHVTLPVGIGGGLILLGTSIIIYFHG